MGPCYFVYHGNIEDWKCLAIFDLINLLFSFDSDQHTTRPQIFRIINFATDQFNTRPDFLWIIGCQLFRISELAIIIWFILSGRVSNSSRFTLALFLGLLLDFTYFSVWLPRSLTQSESEIMPLASRVCTTYHFRIIKNRFHNFTNQLVDLLLLWVVWREHLVAWICTVTMGYGRPRCYTFTNKYFVRGFLEKGGN